MEHALKLKTGWEHDEVPTGKATQRGLLLEITGREMKKDIRKERPALNLALVIDRSGSMSGERLAAARKAAIGISQLLRKRDRLSIVAYDTEILVLLGGVKQNKAGRKAAKAAISELQPGGCTDLGGGWMMGAKCVAEMMERKGLMAGHVLLLSDGKANAGITEPDELGRHAGEMATRGVTSSCVGVGHGYSPLQLDAIADAGRGQLHHSGDPEEIVDVVMGELGEMTKVAAHSARLRLHFPEETKVQQLTRFRSDDSGQFIELDLGNIPSGRTRKVAFMVKVGNRLEPGAQLSFKARLEWNDDDHEPVAFDSDLQLSVVDQATFDPQGKNRKVARKIAELWLARMGYEAIVFNERHDFREAVDTFTRNDIALESLIAELKEKDRQILLDQKRRAQASVAAEWSGPGKLVALSLAKKAMRSEVDHTGRKPDDWSDNARD